MNKSTKGTKDAGTCSVCWGKYKVQKKDGKLHKHGNRGSNGRPCPGSYKPPNSTISNKTRKSDIHTSKLEAPSRLPRRTQRYRHASSIPSGRLQWTEYPKLCVHNVQQLLTISSSKLPTSLQTFKAGTPSCRSDQPSLPNHREDEPIGTRPIWCWRDWLDATTTQVLFLTPKGEMLA